MDCDFLEDILHLFACFDFGVALGSPLGMDSGEAL